MAIAPGRRILGPLVLLLALPMIAIADDDHVAIITADFEAMRQATLAGDYETIAGFTYPRLIEMIGGREQMVQMIGNAMAQLEEQGYHITERELLSVSPIVQSESGAESYAIFETVLELHTPDGKMRQKSFSIAISTDGGKSFKYLDAGNLPPEQLRMMLPGLPEDLELPAPEEPEVIPAGAIEDPGQP